MTQLDPSSLRDRYRHERDKRLRSDAGAQYQAPEGLLTRFASDPYADPEFHRDPISEQVDVLVIGGGFGGLMVGSKLVRAGIDNVRIIDKAADFGGTWYWNRYPGAACDIESYIYLPFLEELGYVPREKYAQSPEIFEHCRRIARHFELYDKALFQTEVTELRWLDDEQRWRATTSRGDTIHARFVTMSAGPLHRLKLPGIPGIETFRGHSFHTSRWDYRYTGGDYRGRLSGLADKRVGIIGTGATAVQCIPHLAASARHLSVFQRTPSAVGPRGNRPTDMNDWSCLPVGWQRRRMENFTNLLAGVPQSEDLVADGWTHLTNLGEGGPREQREADNRKMNLVRERVDALVADPATAEALKPWYNVWCKRPCFHDDYLQSFNRDNVTLVDTDGRGVDAFTENGAVVAGREIALDCVVFATGFEFQTDYARRTGYEIYGRNGQSLSKKWRDGLSTLHGMMSAGFPNCLIVSSAQSAVTANFTHMFEEVSDHITWLIGRCLTGGIATIEPTAAAEREWVDHILALAEGRRRFVQDCTPGFYNNEGNPSTLTLRNGSYAGPPPAFIEILRDWRREGTMRGLDMTREPLATAIPSKR